MATSKQVVLDLYNCDYDILKDKQTLEDILKNILKEQNVATGSFYSQEYENTNNISIIAFNEHGHLVVHAYPEQSFACVDIFTSNANTSIDKIAIKIRQALNSEKSKHTHLQRGDFGSLNDMKPKIRKKTKVWRRVTNTSAKMLNIFKNKKNSSTD